MTDREKTCKECIHNEMCYATHTDDSPCCCDFKDKSKWKEQKRGEWVEDSDGDEYCSNCSRYMPGWEVTGDLSANDYCPNCGADMSHKETGNV